MSSIRQRITPILWFDDQAEEAAEFYCSIFPDSRIENVVRYSKQAAVPTGKKEGSAMTVAFVLDGQQFTGINGGPHFTFNEAVSLVVHSASQEEVDYYWDRLTDGGNPKAQQCAWLKDRYGVSWQVVPDEMIEIFSHPDTVKAQRAMAAMLRMEKIDLAALRRAAEG